MQNLTEKKLESIKLQKEYTEANSARDLEMLKELYGRNKKLPRGYELPALLALAHYPELKNISVEFQFEASNTPLSTQPAKTSLFLAADKRTYIVCLSKKARSTMQSVLMRNLDFNLQVAALGHELGHVIDYMGKTSLGVIRDGILYYTDSHKRKLESTVDAIAIKHGLGYQILAYAELVQKLQKEYPDEKYYQTYFKYYLTPGEIRAKMRQLKMYEE